MSDEKDEQVLSPETRAALKKAQDAPIEEVREAAIVRENKQEMRVLLGQRFDNCNGCPLHHHEAWQSPDFCRGVTPSRALPAGFTRGSDGYSATDFDNPQPPPPEWCPLPKESP